MITRKPKHFAGLDCSGPNKVLPPTFCGVKALVERVGRRAAEAQFAVTPPDEDAPHDIVREFLQDLDYMDAVERQTAITEFSEYVNSLKSSIKSTPAGGAPASGGEGEPPKKGEHKPTE